MAFAKYLAGSSGAWIVTGAHSSIFPYLVAALFKIGFSEVSIKFILEFIPSFILIILAYKIPLMIYDDKRIALICAFLMATFWDLLFYSMRFHLEAPSMLFAFLGIYVFWQGYEKREKIFGKINPDWAIPAAVFFIVIAYSIRRGFFHFGLFLLGYMLLTRKISDLIKDKYNWYAFGILIILFLFFEKVFFVQSIVESSKVYFHTENPLSMVDFQVFGIYFNRLQGGFSSLTYLFYMGFILVLANVLLSLGYIRSGSRHVKGDLFVLLSLGITMSYFIFYQRDIVFGDSRWFYPLLFAAIMCIARAATILPDYLLRYNKILGFAATLMLLSAVIYGGYYEYKHSESIIKYKLDSFKGIKEAGLFIKEISSPADIIVSVPKPQLAYYAERNVTSPAVIENSTKLEKYTQLDEFLEKIEITPSAKYVVITFSEPNHPDFMRRDLAKDNQLVAIQIPFMNTTIDLINGQHQITQEMSYGNITFRLLTVKEDAFVYQILRG